MECTDMQIATELVDLLVKNEQKLSTAESCTGGLIASTIVAVSGASGVFFEGIISYSNDSKISRLGVSPDTLFRHGAVSEQAAIEMAKGLIGSADIAVSTTGIAGPGGGTAQKPVGLVYIGIADRQGAAAYKHMFNGDRDSVRNQAKRAAIILAIRHLREPRR